MTNPGPNPEGTLGGQGGIGGIESYGEKTEDEYKGEMNSRVTGGVNPIMAFASSVPILGDLVESFTGQEDGDYGDIGSFVSLLLGRDSSLAARVANIENKIAVGAEYFDNFKRGDNAGALGSPEPGVVPDWIQFGDGEPLGIQDQAAQLRRNALPDDGIRYARCPFLATSSDYRVAAVIHPRGTPPIPRTSLYGRCNADMTAGVYLDMKGDATTLGRFTRSGLSMSYTQWAATTTKAYSNSSTPELRMSGTRYQVVIDGVVILDHTDTANSIPLDSTRRTSGFSQQCWTGILAVPQFSAGLASFSVRNDNLTAVQAATAEAKAATTTANAAVGTAVEAATNAAAGAVAGAVDTAIAPVKSQIDSTAAAVITFREGLPLRPFSHSMTNSEMTFDRTMLQIPPLAVVSGGGSTGSSTAGPNTNSHSHSMGHSHSVSVNALFTPAANSIAAGFIRATWGGQRDSFTYATGPVSSPCSHRVVIGTMNPENGNITIRWVSDERTEVIGSGSGEFVVTIPDGVVIPDKETVFLGIHQYGSGSVRPLFGLTLAGLQRDGLLFPAKPNTRFGQSSPLTADTVIAAGALLFDNDQLPWLGIGPSITLKTPPPTSWYENFDDNLMPSTFASRGNHFSGIGSGALVYSSGSDGFAGRLDTRRLNRDDHWVQGTVTSPTGRGQHISLRSDTGLYNRVEMSLTSATVQINRQGSASTTLASASVTVADGQRFRLAAVGNVFTAYRVESNNTLTELCSYTDSANALAKGIDNRYIGCGVSRSVFQNSGGWNDITASDFADPVTP